MKIVDLQDCEEFTAGDATTLKELFNPLKSAELNFRYSLAHARLAPGGVSKKHKLKTSEVYYIISGEGVMHVDAESSQVKAGQAVYIPPDSLQYIENSGEVELVFLCIVDPAWRPEDEQVV